MPLRQSQAVADFPVGAAFKLWVGAFGSEQTFLLLLIDPSLQTNLPPAQWETPPLLPEHGVLAACESGASASVAARRAVRRIISGRCRPAAKLDAGIDGRHRSTLLGA